MNCDSIIFDESERVEKMKQHADAFAKMTNTVLLNNLNDLFGFCFEELRDFSVEGFDNLYSALNKYFDCLERTAVLVKDKNESFRREFVSIVCEQIEVLYMGTSNTGSEHIFLRRIGIKDGFYSIDTVREEVEKMIGHGVKDDEFSLFEQDTATDKTFYPNLVELERKRGQSESGEIPEKPILEVFMEDSMMPSSVDMKEPFVDRNLWNVSYDTRLKLMLAAGAIIAIGVGGIFVQRYAISEKLSSVTEGDKSKSDDKGRGVSLGTDSNTRPEEKQAFEQRESFVTCRIDRDADSYKNYMVLLESGSPKIFVSNFKNAAVRAQVETSTADVGTVKRDLFNVFLSEMSVYEHDKLTQQFVEIHSRNFNSYDGSNWRDASRQTALIYNAIEPDCE